MKTIIKYLWLINIIILSACSHPHRINDNSAAQPDSVIVDTTTIIPQRIGIKMQKNGGVYEIPCIVNGLKMNFIFDTGASNVCISLTEALFMYKNGYITEDDLGERSYSQVADGRIVANMQLNLKTIEIEGVVLNNVDALVVASMEAPLLLGQSAIQQIGKIEMDGDSLFIIGIPTSPLPSVQPQQNNTINIMPAPVITWWDKVKIFFGSEEIIDELINAAKNAHENGMDERAELYIKQAIALKEKCWKPYAYYALFQKDEYERLYPKYSRMRNIDLAVINYEHAIELNGKHRSFYYYDGDSITYDMCRNNLCRAYVDADEMWMDYRNRCEGKDKKPKYYGVYNRNNLYDTSIDNLYDTSIEFIQALIIEQPNNTQAISSLSTIYAINREYDKADMWAEKLAKLDESKYLFRKAWIEQLKGDNNKAIEYYEKVLEIDYQDASAMDNLANALYERNNYTERAIGYHYKTYDENSYYADGWGGWIKKKGTHKIIEYEYNYYDKNRAIELKKKAAKLGNKNAQYWLKEKGYDK